MKLAMRTLIFVLLIWKGPVLAGDIIGNAGGIWACTPNGAVEPTKMLFVDLFEAREQQGWTLLQANPGELPMALVDRVLTEMKSTFPTYAPLWESALNQVKASIHFVSDNAELEEIDDSLFQIRPSARTCLNGLWEYKQWANFNEQGQVLISETYWNSPLLTVVEKSGLIWHEAIYLWFRNSYQDINSVRARILTGLIFANNVSVVEKRHRLNNLLQAPTTAGDNWFCSLQNDFTHVLFGAYASSELEANASVQQICQSADESFFCKENNVKCSAIDSDHIRWVCKVKNSFDKSVYLGRGREKAEAAFRAQETCQFSTGKYQKLFCVDSEPVCSSIQ